jgi:hypothetical protein
MKVLRLGLLVATALFASEISAQDISRGRWVDLTHAFNDKSIYWPTAEPFKKTTVFHGHTPLFRLACRQAVDETLGAGTSGIGTINTEESLMADAAIRPFTVAGKLEGDLLIGARAHPAWHGEGDRFKIEVMARPCPIPDHAVYQVAVEKSLAADRRCIIRCCGLTSASSGRSRRSKTPASAHCAAIF